MNDISKLSFIKTTTRIPISALKLIKRKNGDYREHSFMFFKRRCLSNFTYKSMQELAVLLNIKVEVLELFMEANLTVDLEFAEQLSRATKVDTATWLELQRQYDDYIQHP